jgi:hypothetical protein
LALAFILVRQHFAICGLSRFSNIFSVLFDPLESISANPASQLLELICKAAKNAQRRSERRLGSVTFRTRSENPLPFSNGSTRATTSSTGYPDELFYSICARFSDRMAYPRVGTILREMCMSEYAAITLTVPHNLDALAASLPPRQRCTADRLIENHTLLPYWAPFLEKDQLAMIRASMKHEDGATAHRSSALIGADSRWLRTLRYCPACSAEDRERFRETYWHRLHQAPAVEVCPMHGVFLHRFKAGFRYLPRDRFISAESSCPHFEPKPVQRNRHNHNVLMGIARDTQWLLEHPNMPNCSDRIREGYFKLLPEHLTQGSRVRAREMEKSLADFYSDSLWRMIRYQRPIQGKPFRLSGLCCRRCRVRTPFAHLLLIQFLGHTVESFFKFLAETFATASEQKCAQT